MKKLDPVELLDDVPSAQILELPKQLVYLSQDRINFGDIPAGCFLRSAIVVHNKSARSVSFRWNMSEVPDNLVTIEPSVGHLKPNESAICRLFFQPTFEPHIYETDICCEVMNEDEAV